MCIGSSYIRLGEYYSYENGLETHTSFKANSDIDRLILSSSIKS